MCPINALLRNPRLSHEGKVCRQTVEGTKVQPSVQEFPPDSGWDYSSRFSTSNARPLERSPLPVSRRTVSQIVTRPVRVRVRLYAAVRRVPVRGTSSSLMKYDWPAS